MKEIKRLSGGCRHILYTSIGTVLLISAAFIDPINHYISALLLLIGSVVLYFLFAVTLDSKNYLSLKAVFTLVWLFTIGLADLKLVDYQEQWQRNTWFLLALAYAMFQIGILLGSRLGGKIADRLTKKRGLQRGRLKLELRPERLFGICVVVSAVGLICFVANVCIRGWIPYFVKETGMYAQFYTKFYLFAVAASMISGLCYYCLKTQQLAKWKKAILIFCILYSTFIFPILVVSRGTFICSALSLTAAIFYLNKKKFWVLVTCVVVMFGVYEIGSAARNYTSDQLNALFQPSEIVINPGTDNPLEPDDNPNIENPGKLTFQLPGKVAFLYSYLTIGHDNFNEAVQNATEYTYGVRQLKPFNVLLRSSKIDNIIDNGERCLVRPYLTTINLIGNSYYDLRWFGVGFFMLVWAIGFGMIESCYLKGKGIFSLLVLGNTLTPVVLCFFESWMSEFSVWMHWGLILILCLIACVTLLPKKKSNTKNKSV